MKFTLFLLGIILFAMACQHVIDDDLFSKSAILEENGKSILELQTQNSYEVTPSYMPLDSIPQWVREKVTSEEYELWRTMSTKYEIDYSILKSELTKRQRDSVYRIVEKLSQDIRDGKVRKNAGYFIIHNLSKSKINNRLETLSDPESDGEISRTGGPSILYSIPNGQANVYVTIVYYVNTKNKEITKVDKPNAYAGGLNAVSFNGSCTANAGTTAVVVEGSGTLKYLVEGYERENNFYNRTVTIGAVF